MLEETQNRLLEILEAIPVTHGKRTIYYTGGRIRSDSTTYRFQFVAINGSHLMNITPLLAAIGGFRSKSDTTPEGLQISGGGMNLPLHIIDRVLAIVGIPDCQEKYRIEAL